MGTARIPIAHPVSSRSASTAKDARIVNAFIETEEGKKYIIKRPGLASFAVTPAQTSSSAQGIYAFKGTGKLYSIVNNTVNEITSAGASTNKGAVTAGLYTFTETSDMPYLFFHNGTNAYNINGTSGAFLPLVNGSGSVVTNTINGAGTITVFAATAGSGYSSSVSVSIVDTGVSLTTNAITTSDVTLHFAATTGALAGQLVVGTGIPSGTTVVSTTGTTVVLNTVVTVSNSTPITFSGVGGSLTVTSTAGAIGGATIVNGGVGYTASTVISIVDNAADFPTNQTPAMTLVPGAVYLDDTVYVMTTNGRIYNSNIEDTTVWNALNYVVKSSEPDGGVAITKHLSYLVAFGGWSGEYFYDAAAAVGSPLQRNDTAKMEIGCANAQSVVQILTAQTVMWVGQGRETGRGVYRIEGQAPQKISTKSIDAFLNADAMTNVRAWSVEVAGHVLYVLTLKDSGYTFVYDLHEKAWTQFTSDNGAGAESYFTPEFFASMGGISYVQLPAGVISKLSETTYQDLSANINYRIVTPKFDNNNNKHKFWFSLEVIGDLVPGSASIRHTNDDYQTWSAYRTVDLSSKRPIIYQLGIGRRKAFDLVCTINQPIRIEALEADVQEGDA